MRAAVYHGPRDIKIDHVPDPVIQSPTDALVRITHACICGTDLWFYRGLRDYEPGWRTGHELMGIVEAVGSEVRTVKPGDRVLAPFAFSDGTCEFCHKGLHTSCLHGGFWATTHDGGQGEAVRAPWADGTLVPIPDNAANDEQLLMALLPLTDVMGTGHHAALAAGVTAGSTVAVVGDGAVGLCGVLAARRLGAERIIILGRHPARLELARRFGATDFITSRDDEAIAAVRDMTAGGAECVMECVGAAQSMTTAIGIARPGGAVGYVGVPHSSGEGINLGRLFSNNIALRGGVAPVRAYIPDLMRDVLAGTLDPSPVLDMHVNLDGVPAGYAAMDDRSAIKVLVRPGM